jgi:hypothetical protein
MAKFYTYLMLSKILMHLFTMKGWCLVNIWAIYFEFRIPITRNTDGTTAVASPYAIHKVTAMNSELSASKPTLDCTTVLY